MDRLRSLSPYPPVHALSRIGRSRMSSTTSLMKLSWGVNGMALPKHPQLRTHWFGMTTSMPFSTMVLLPKGSQWSVYHVSQVKNSMSTRVNAVVNRGMRPPTGPRRAAPRQCSPACRAEGPRRPRLEVQCAGLEVLLKLVHEAECVIDLDQTGNDEQGPDQNAAEVGEGEQELSHGVESPSKFREQFHIRCRPLTGD